MSQQQNALQVLEQLRQMRERSLEEASRRLVAQQQRCQRYRHNIAALDAINQSCGAGLSDASQMCNQAHFKATVQRVIDWQKQEQALAEIEQRALALTVRDSARREQSLAQHLEIQRQHLRLHRQVQQQKQTDELAMQSWRRRRRAL